MRPQPVGLPLPFKIIYIDILKTRNEVQPQIHNISVYDFKW